MEFVYSKFLRDISQIHFWFKRILKLDLDFYQAKCSNL